MGYYCSFCLNFPTVPLTDLLKSKVKFDWFSNCGVTFENLKALLFSSPVLAAPCFDRPFSVQLNASHVGTVAVLQQSGTAGVIHPVRFFLQKFTNLFWIKKPWCLFGPCII